jgi:hypothetical protein
LSSSEIEHEPNAASRSLPRVTMARTLSRPAWPGGWEQGSREHRAGYQSSHARSSSRRLESQRSGAVGFRVRERIIDSFLALGFRPTRPFDRPWASSGVPLLVQQIAESTGFKATFDNGKASCGSEIDHASHQRIEEAPHGIAPGQVAPFYSMSLRRAGIAV